MIPLPVPAGLSIRPSPPVAIRKSRRLLLPFAAIHRLLRSSPLPFVRSYSGLFVCPSRLQQFEHFRLLRNWLLPPVPIRNLRGSPPISCIMSGNPSSSIRTLRKIQDPSVCMHHYRYIRMNCTGSILFNVLLLLTCSVTNHSRFVAIT